MLYGFGEFELRLILLMLSLLFLCGGQTTMQTTCAVQELHLAALDRVKPDLDLLAHLRLLNRRNDDTAIVHGHHARRVLAFQAQSVQDSVGNWSTEEDPFHHLCDG